MNLLSDPASDARVLTKSDTATNHGKFRALYVGGTGDVSVLTKEGNTVLFSAVPVGAILPIQGTRLNSTNTTATLVVALY